MLIRTKSTLVTNLLFCFVLVCCDYSFHVAVTWWNEKVKDEMRVLTTERGINSFKAFMAYKGVFQLSDAEVSPLPDFSYR